MRHLTSFMWFEDECFTSVDLVNAYFRRINDVNSTLHAVLEVNPDALDIAKQLDQEREMGHLRGPLHGLPVFVKDSISTRYKMQTAAGSFALVGAKLDDDSTVVARLREHGLVILGKTSLSEWASTYAAYYPKQDPNGSSSGSAVATDLGLAFAALGTETSGSILFPSEVSNIVGIKPTVVTGLSNTSPEFWAMYQKSLYYGGEGGLLGALSRHQLDAIILPTGTAADIPALVGAPVTTVPMGAFPNSSAIKHNDRGDMVYIAPGIPFGISFLGKQWSEKELIGMAYAFEQRTLVRKTLKRVVEPKGELRDVIGDEDEGEDEDEDDGHDAGQCGL
ncbi:putative amidase [Aspergillus affinis]|uniref:putative amidase n=1 Tax=Aspergillus affinis TaxID=1070780 RepID=UPI0022FDB983|nr:putative amidase [Aspergillus affinis]KAI9042780.1 putative amidase [Aspergillus affinis]